MNVKGLVRFFTERKVDPQAKRPKLAKALWSMWRTDEQDTVKLKELAQSGRSLEQMETCACGGWKCVLEAKVFYVAHYDAQSKSVSGSDRDRLIGAASWSAIEGFFKELELRKKVGRDAYLKLKDMRENV